MRLRTAAIFSTMAFVKVGFTLGTHRYDFLGVGDQAASALESALLQSVTVK